MRRFAPHVPASLYVRSPALGICRRRRAGALNHLMRRSPGRNVNMVAGTTWPDGDPFLQRQNEPSIAASTRNPLHLLAGANDYRTVDMPGLADGDETGDAWLGLFKSFDGGQRWISTLLPGLSAGHSPEPASPRRSRATAPAPTRWCAPAPTA